MKLIKLALAATIAAIFAVACTSETNTNQVANVNTAASPGASPATTAQATPTPVADEFAQTRIIYAESCTICHKAQGEGGTVTIQGKTIKVPSLKEGHALNHNEAQLAKQINNGGDGMPAFKDRLKPDQVNDLVRFIRKEFQGKEPSKGASPAPASKS